MRAMHLFLAGALLLAASLGVRADAPAGRYTVDAETVCDTATDLVWQRTPAAQTYAWADALAACTGVWRLPNIRELQSLVDVRRYRPALDAAAFPGAPPEPFWSSTADPSSEEYAMLVNFNDGRAHGERVGVLAWVRCVR